MLDVVPATAMRLGKLIPLDVKAGDQILFGKWSGTETLAKEIKLEDNSPQCRGIAAWTSQNPLVTTDAAREAGPTLWCPHPAGSRVCAPASKLLPCGCVIL